MATTYPRDAILAEPTQAQAALIDERSRRFFKAALESALEASMEECNRIVGADMSFATAVLIISRVAREEVMRVTPVCGAFTSDSPRDEA